MYCCCFDLLLALSIFSGSQSFPILIIFVFKPYGLCSNYPCPRPQTAIDIMQKKKMQLYANKTLFPNVGGSLGLDFGLVLANLCCTQ